MHLPKCLIPSPHIRRVASLGECALRIYVHHTSICKITRLLLFTIPFHKAWLPLHLSMAATRTSIGNPLGFHVKPLCLATE